MVNARLNGMGEMGGNCPDSEGRTPPRTTATNCPPSLYCVGDVTWRAAQRYLSTCIRRAQQSLNLGHQFSLSGGLGESWHRGPFSQQVVRVVPAQEHERDMSRFEGATNRAGVSAAKRHIENGR